MATKKITLNELRSLVKQIIKENVEPAAPAAPAAQAAAPRLTNQEIQFLNKIYGEIGQAVELQGVVGNPKIKAAGYEAYRKIGEMIHSK